MNEIDRLLGPIGDPLGPLRPLLRLPQEQLIEQLGELWGLGDPPDDVELQLCAQALRRRGIGAEQAHAWLCAAQERADSLRPPPKSPEQRAADDALLRAADDALLRAAAQLHRKGAAQEALVLLLARGTRLCAPIEV